MKTEHIKYKYNAYINYTITDNICTICANNPLNIKNNWHLLGRRIRCEKCNECVCECNEFKNYNDLIKNL